MTNESVSVSGYVESMRAAVYRAMGVEAEALWLEVVRDHPVYRVVEEMAKAISDTTYEAAIDERMENYGSISDPPSARQP